MVLCLMKMVYASDMVRKSLSGVPAFTTVSFHDAAHHGHFYISSLVHFFFTSVDDRILIRNYNIYAAVSTHLLLKQNHIIPFLYFIVLLISSVLGLSSLIKDPHRQILN